MRPWEWLLNTGKLYSYGNNAYEVNEDVKNEITEKGMFSPEFVMPVEIFFKELAQKGLYVYENGRKINALEKEIAKSKLETIKEKVREVVSLSPVIN